MLFMAYVEGKDKGACYPRDPESIKDSVYGLFVEVIKMYKLESYFKITRDDIILKHNGSSVIFSGTHPLNTFVNKLKSMVGIGILFVEEAADIKKEVWDIILPTIRKEGSFVISCMNPTRTGKSWLYKNYIDVAQTPKDALVIKLNYTDNPHISKVFIEMAEAERDKTRRTIAISI